MSERDVREGLAEALCSAVCEGDAPAPIPDAENPRHRIAACYEHQRATDAVIASDVVAQMLAEAEQRGREDNADHGTCATPGRSRRADYRGRPVSPCECCPFCACAGCEWQGGGESEALSGPVAPERVEVGHGATDQTKAPQIGVQRFEGKR